ncbi:DUF423 domain-containing protein [Fulvimarina endophytica]|uniref:DUF423 domain-containing protein n=1 Tax=Fulvimarina endophytica TaxID=2293836 RepID=A0A371X0A8_9HYPH|nr:DUF423 domain-containing protein [Fulvimarina endophytica]RFC62671.1 DUF423 domain-containing protein [Fulvimarina endophytica]
MTHKLQALVRFLAGLVGAGGVALAAYASHGTSDPSLALPAAGILLAHAPALLALSLRSGRGQTVSAIIALLMAAGVALFSGDLASRIWTGSRLFEGAAPLGGMAIIASWLMICGEALVSAFRRT